MANRKVTLLLHCKTEKGWRRLPAVIGKNGRVRPNFAMVNGEPVEFLEGHYELRHYVGARPVHRNVGHNAAEAMNEQRRQEQLLIARDAAVLSGTKLVEAETQLTLARLADKFVKAAVDRGSLVAAKNHRKAIDEFLRTLPRNYPFQMTADDMPAHLVALRKRGLSNRTLYNHYKLLRPFLLSCGIPIEVIGKTAPAYEKRLPEIYEQEELGKFMRSLIKPYDRLVFTLLLMTGLREQEAMFLEWTDISDWKSLTVRSKPEDGFTIKDKEERSLGLPDELRTLLRAYKASNPTMRFVIGTKEDRPNTKLLRLLKVSARAAGVNCERCPACKERKECENWYLHKFRSTFCTKLLRGGFDLRTVQQLMGHSDIASTMRYLRPEDNSETATRMNAIQWTS